MQHALWDLQNSVTLYFLRPATLAPASSPVTFWGQVYTTLPSVQDLQDQDPGVLASPITTGTWNATLGSYAITIPVVADPDRNADTSEKLYYLGYRAELSAGQFQTGVLVLFYKRHDPFLSMLNIGQTDLEAVDRNVTYLFGNGAASIAGISALVKHKLLGHFKARGARLSDVQNLGDLKYPAVLLALGYAYATEIQNDGDGPITKSRFYMAEGEKLLKDFVVEFAPSAQAPQQNGSISQGSIRIYG